jgi:hypothetical protein
LILVHVMCSAFTNFIGLKLNQKYSHRPLLQEVLHKKIIHFKDQVIAPPAQWIDSK